MEGTLRDRWLGAQPTKVPLSRPFLSHLAHLPVSALPKPVRECPEAIKYLALLGDLDWEHFPERPTNRPWPGPTPASRAPFVAAYLVKLNEQLSTFQKLREHLVEHPALVWVLGFPLVPDPTQPWGFDGARSVPSRKQLGRILRELDNAALQFLLAASVRCIAALALRFRPLAGIGVISTLDCSCLQELSSSPDGDWSHFYFGLLLLAGAFIVP